MAKARAETGGNSLGPLTNALTYAAAKALVFLRRIPMNARNAAPIPIIAQVDGSGTPEVMLWLNPVIDPPPMRLSRAPSVMLKAEFALNAASLLPAKLSGSVAGVPDTVSNKAPGVLLGFAPWVLSGSAQN